ncbi:MAG: ribonuclease P protein component [Paracoccaceae bacterium]
MRAGAPGTPLSVLKKRREFLACARARRHTATGLLLQARRRRADEPGEGVRVGYTCSKKIGNAVVRNRAKRRLRAVARDVLPAAGRPGWDYVLIGRPDATVARSFDALLADLAEALARVHAPKRSDGR